MGSDTTMVIMRYYAILLFSLLVDWLPTFYMKVLNWL